MARNESMTGTSADAIEFLVSQHREFEQRLHLLLDGSRQPGRGMDEIAAALIHQLVAHAAAEEEVLYPVMRDVLPNGDHLANDGIKEHEEVERILTDLDGMTSEDPKFFTLVEQIRQKLQHHIQDEEEKDFPQLRAHCPEPRLMELGKKLADAFEGAPTHPHPNAPDTPPLNKVTNSAAAAVDKLRDKLRAA